MGRPLHERQHIPPARHLRKAQARLDRLNEVFPDTTVLAVGKKDIPCIEDRKAYVTHLELVLRDYEEILDGLLPPEDNDD